MQKKFLGEFAMIVAGGIILILLCNLFPPFQEAAHLSWASLIFFSGLMMLIHLLGLRAIRSTNVNSLTQLILAVVMIKLICCAAIIVGYQHLAQPSSNWFVVPFLLLYLLFTVYEVILLNRLNRTSVG